MKSWRYKHLHRCSECGAVHNCVESACIGDGSLPPPEGYLETCVNGLPYATGQFAAAFKDAAIKCHIGFKHDGPWEKCEWIECEDRRKMVEAWPETTK